MDEKPPGEDGILSSIVRMFDTLREVGENRVELFLVEVQEQRIRLFDALLLLAAGIVCVTMLLVMVTFTLVVVFWDTHRLLVLSLLLAAYAGATVLVLVTLRSRLRQWRAFSATLAQLKKDSACFKKPN